MPGDFVLDWKVNGNRLIVGLWVVCRTIRKTYNKLLRLRITVFVDAISFFMLISYITGRKSIKMKGCCGQKVSEKILSVIIHNAFICAL